MGFMQINGINFDIPQELDLTGSLDEYSGTYRISLGIVEPTPDQCAQLDPLFAAIEQQRRGLFIESIMFGEGNDRLKMDLATVDVYKKPYGTFYELESSIADTKLSAIKEGTKRDTNRRASVAKGSKTDGKRKATRKRD